MNLFYNFNESNVVENVKMKWPSDEYVIPQGTPMSRTGIANNGDAIGILARDAVVKFPYPLSVAKLIGKKEPKGNEDYTFAIITSGFLNLSEVEKAFGDKISDEAKKAMANINFVDDTAPKSFGGGASSWNDLKDKPFSDEIKEVTLFEKSDLLFKIESSDVSYTTDEIKFELKEGELYNVYWDGVLYEKTPCYVKDGILTVGSTEDELLSGVNDYPFYFHSAVGSGGYVQIMSNDNEDTHHSVKIVHLKTVSIPIDARYLKMLIVELTFDEDTSTATSACNLSFEDIVEILENSYFYNAVCINRNVKSGKTSNYSSNPLSVQYAFGENIIYLSMQNGYTLIMDRNGSITVD